MWMMCNVASVVFMVYILIVTYGWCKWNKVCAYGGFHKYVLKIACMHSLVVDEVQCGICGSYGVVIECDILVVQLTQGVCMWWLLHKYVLTIRCMHSLVVDKVQCGICGVYGVGIERGILVVKVA
jgi:hypothetical protein